MRFVRSEHVVWREYKEYTLSATLGKYPFGRHIKRWEANIKMGCIASFDVSGV
jgi:hypothetical protein